MSAPATAPTDRAPASAVPTVRIRLTIAYDGTGYAGWQVQKIGLGVQQRVEEALSRLFRSRPQVHGSSRTDAGVHARGLVAHLDIPRSEWRMTASKLRLALNAHLPEDIRVLVASRCRPDFHARFDALRKQYRYFVWNHPAMNPLLRQQAWHVPQKLDLAALRLACAGFLGRQDFRSLTANPGYERKSTVRTIGRCAVRRQGPLLTFILEADGFLYKMCRGIVGTLVQVGMGKIAPAEIAQLLAHRDRRVAGMTAPAHGLVLWKVDYPTAGHSHGQRETHGTADAARS
jgi:tRNA pseudouridine38-40 synthase